MNYLVAFLIFGVCFFGMALGLVFAQKVLKKGCSIDPSDPNSTCACKEKEDAAARAEGDGGLMGILPSLKPKKNP